METILLYRHHEEGLGRILNRGIDITDGGAADTIQGRADTLQGFGEHTIQIGRAWLNRDAQYFVGYMH